VEFLRTIHVTEVPILQGQVVLKRKSQAPLRKLTRNTSYVDVKPARRPAQENVISNTNPNATALTRASHDLWSSLAEHERFQFRRKWPRRWHVLHNLYNHRVLEETMKGTQSTYAHRRSDPLTLGAKIQFMEMGWLGSCRFLFGSILFASTFLLIVTEKIHRVYATLLGSTLGLFLITITHEQIHLREVTGPSQYCYREQAESKFHGFRLPQLTPHFSPSSSYVLFAFSAVC